MYKQSFIKPFLLTKIKSLIKKRTETLKHIVIYTCYKCYFIENVFDGLLIKYNVY